MYSDCFLDQLVFVAYDTSNPTQKARAEVTVSVTRNEHAPVFSKAIYEEEISENFPLGDVIVQVAATDIDSDDVLRYEVVEEEGSDAFLASFWLNPETGAVTAVKPLTEAEETRFEVSERRLSSTIYKTL